MEDPRDDRQLLESIHGQLQEIRNSLDVVALALAIGLEIRLLGGHITEADIRNAAEHRLRRIIEAGARAGPG